MEIEIQVWKHDGRAHWRHPSTLTREDDGFMMTFTPEGTPFTNLKGAGHAQESWTSYYWPDRWYNVVQFTANDEHPAGWYCNVAAPPTLVDGVLSYVDYELDLMVYPAADGMTWELLDEDEFEEACERCRYDEALIARCRAAVDELIAMIEAREYPFDQLQTPE
jgi:protein associated with RNAse G/E